MSHLLRLIYVSCAKVPLEPAFVDALLLQARTNNEALGITGVLCTGRGYFVQSIEGPEAQVLDLYARILRDERHHQSALLSINLVAKRIFAQWTMAHVDGETLGNDLHGRLVSQVLLERDLSEPLKLLQGTLKALRRAA